MEKWNFWVKIVTAVIEIEKIPDSKLKDEELTKLKAILAQEWSQSPENILSRFIEIGTDIKVINISGKLLELLKESIFCYLNNQYVATIATTGIASEIFCSFIYSMFLEEQGFDDFEVRKKIEAFNQISQQQKIEILFSVVHLIEPIIGRLEEIRDIRNKNLHPSNNRGTKDDALNVLKNLITILHGYSNHIENITSQKEQTLEGEEEITQEPASQAEIKN